ncbi:MAG: hypothetical protein K5768_04930 [Firmicutes bacterium]|nr:hypothetical protein [Bacillota bacterium]
MKLYKSNDEYRVGEKPFKVTACGNEIKVVSCDVSAYPFNQVWQGKQRNKNQTELSYYVMLGSNDPVNIEVEALFDFEEVVVRPLSKKVTTSVKENVVKATFDGPGQYSIEFDGIHRSLAVFINPEKDFEKDTLGENLLYFGAGTHILDERIELCDNQTVFIDEGAVLYASINATDKKNIRVIGYGILDNSRMQRADEINGCAVLAKREVAASGNPIFFNRCSNVIIDGVTIVDSSGWNVHLDGCDNVLIDNIKIIGQWRYNADGCDFCNCTNAVIRNSFLRTFDDSIVVKGFKLNGSLPVQNILAENCVLWCDWGKALEVGVETCAPYMDTIVFKNCEIIHGTTIMLDIQQGDGSDVENVRFSNINIEYSGYEMKPVHQEREDGIYPLEDSYGCPVPIAISIGNSIWSTENTTGNTKNVYFENINIISDKKDFPRGSEFLSENENSSIEGIFINNIMLNGRSCEFSEIGLDIGNKVNNVFYNDKKVK